jgi:uncharacterized membrane protein YedE/YeeE
MRRLHQPATEARPVEPFGHLLYRYFFFDWLFRDVSRGSPLERAAARRFNCEMRRHLPAYLRRWIFVLIAGYTLGAGLENGFGSVYAAACCIGASCVSASVIFMIAYSWLTLKYSSIGR